MYVCLLSWGPTEGFWVYRLCLGPLGSVGSLASRLKPFSSVEEFAGKDLYPAFLARVSVEYHQQPTYDMLKRLLTSIQTDMRTVKWDDQHAIKVKVELRNATTGKREAAVTHTFVAIGGDGLFLGAQQRIGNSSKEAKNIWGAFVTKELKPWWWLIQTTLVERSMTSGVTIPTWSMSSRDPHHSLRIVSDAVDPTHPLAGKFCEDWRNAHWIKSSKALHIM